MRALSSLMLTARRARQRGELAFTLAELAIVIAILAVLVSIAVPVLLGQSHKAEHAVAVENLMTASKTVDNLWFNELANQPCPITTGAYRDYDPPPELSPGAEGFVPIDAEYMSLREPKMTWVDVSVGGGSGGVSPMIASLNNGEYAQAASNYTLEGIWKNGVQIAYGSEIASDWEQMAGKVGVVENRFFWDEGWQDNADNQYLTLMTLEVTKGLAHFYTLNVGVTVAGGTFEWRNGSGTPGDSFGDELASDVPSGDDPPPGGDDPPPPGDDDPPPPGDDDPPPPGDDDPPPPGDDDPPPTTEPEPPSTEPEPPTSEPTPPEPPDGPNQASSIRITPQSLNVNANGVFKARIELNSGYDADEINISSVRAYGAAAFDAKTSGNGTLTISFNREDLSGVPVGDHILFLVTGTYNDGTPFQAWDYIKVIDHEE